MVYVGSLWVCVNVVYYLFENELHTFDKIQRERCYLFDLNCSRVILIDSQSHNFHCLKDIQQVLRHEK